MTDNLQVRMIILAAAFILDLILGDPKGIPHIVVFIGKLIKACEDLLWHEFKLSVEEDEDKRKKLACGFLLWIIVCGLSVSVPMLFVRIVWSMNEYAGIVLEVLICWQLLAVRSLFGESIRVYRALGAHDIKGARLAVSMIVGRDTDRLDEKGIIRAAVETVAESTSDGIAAPLFFMALLGLPGMLLYKACNTLDSMVGYKNERYIYFGRFCARMDDILNFIPARLTGFIMAVLAGAAGLDPKGAMRIFLRDRKNHSSPNSAHCEAAMAGALNVRLGGDAWYFGKRVSKKFIGDPEREVVTEDIRNANKLMLVTACFSWLSLLLVLLVITRCI
ncbi:MAG: adenosylcobinamide-phosphate synthase CbiB [Lachnospiraceae bacterium]|nr:adenosylcobinamide-phosphate synthase CbiB [Lachnospiraceae bacterium]